MDQQFSEAYLAQNRGPMTVAIVVTFPAIALVTVLLRLYTRAVVIRNAALEDYSIVIAMLLSIGVTVATCYEVHYGLGRHLAALDPSQFVGQFKSLFATIIMYNWGLLFTKLSILLQYLRISVHQGTRRIIYCLMAFVTAYGIETFFSGTFTCTPVAYFWDTTIPGGHCVNKYVLYFANAGINIVTDFALLTLPIIILKDLIMPSKQKMVLIGILALGGAACIASIFRLHSLYILSKSEDVTWQSPGTAFWSCIELNVGIICASISTLRPLFSRMLPSIFGSSHSTGPSSNRTPRWTPQTFSRSHRSQRTFNELHSGSLVSNNVVDTERGPSPVDEESSEEWIMGRLKRPVPGTFFESQSDKE